jgi:NAD(P)H-dependent FMN reductase
MTGNPRLLALAASSRAKSFNRTLIQVAAGLVTKAGAGVDLAEFREFDMPPYDADVQESSGMPAGAMSLRDRLAGVAGLLLASPEYNYSMPGTLKNAIDWVSRFRPVPLRGKSAFLLSASNGALGGNRGLWALRVPLESLGVHVYPDMFSLPHAGSAFTASGGLADGATQERLARMLEGYLKTARALARQ